MRILLILMSLLLAFGSLATTRTPMTSDYHPIHGYCSDINSEKDISWHFCAKQYADEVNGEVHYLLYVEIKNQLTTENTSNLPKFVLEHQLILVNPDTKNIQILEFDGRITLITPDKNTLVHLYLIELPEIYIKLLDENVPLDACVIIDNKKVCMNPTKEEMQELKMIARIKFLP